MRKIRNFTNWWRRERTCSKRWRNLKWVLVLFCFIIPFEIQLIFINHISLLTQVKMLMLYSDIGIFIIWFFVVCRVRVTPSTPWKFLKCNSVFQRNSAQSPWTSTQFNNIWAHLSMKHTGSFVIGVPHTFAWLQIN